MQTASPGDGRLDAVGLVPAAGRARRLGERCRSKELEPVYRRGGVGDSAPRPVIERLLDAFSEARLCRVIVVTRIAKADVRKALLAHAGAGTDSPSRPPRPPTIEHVVLEDSPSAAFTVAAGGL